MRRLCQQHKSSSRWVGRAHTHKTIYIIQRLAHRFYSVGVELSLGRLRPTGTPYPCHLQPTIWQLYELGRDHGAAGGWTDHRASLRRLLSVLALDPRLDRIEQRQLICLTLGVLGFRPLERVSASRDRSCTDEV